MAITEQVYLATPAPRLPREGLLEFSGPHGHSLKQRQRPQRPSSSLLCPPYLQFSPNLHFWPVSGLNEKEASLLWVSKILRVFISSPDKCLWPGLLWAFYLASMTPTRDPIKTFGCSRIRNGIPPLPLRFNLRI